jgi:hypothetical protein
MRTILAALTTTAVFGLSSMVHANISVCLTDDLGDPLRRVWVQHWLTDYMTDMGGCVTIITNDTEIDIRVFAQNPVIRMEDGLNFTFAVSREVKVRDGDAPVITAQSQYWRTAELLRNAYNDGLRQFTPWGNREFPSAVVRMPSIGELQAANRGIIRATWPDQSWSTRSWVEGASIYTMGTSVVANGFPLVHLKDDVANDASTLSHELGHALHFSRLSGNLREAMEVTYGLWLASDPVKAHCFARRTQPTVAWIEAFGIFAETLTNSQPGQGQEERLFASLAKRREELVIGTPCVDGDPPFGPSFGADVEGAIVLALFYDYARRSSIGLDFVVTTFVGSEAMDVVGYADYMKRTYGASSHQYRQLVNSLACYGIDVPGTPTVDGQAEGGDEFGAALAVGDFNNDGFQDAAIGSPYEDVGDIDGAGMVSVLYGSQDGLSVLCNCTITEDTLGVPGKAEEGNRFGSALAAGDFDGDGIDDLAIGVPGFARRFVVSLASPDGAIQEIVPAAGRVIVIYGSAAGLDPHVKVHAFAEERGVAAAADSYGASLAAGDFNGDSTIDLAIGVPGNDTAAIDNAGIVHVVFGDEGFGLDATTDQLLSPRANVDFARFGASLATGDFNNDGKDDLAVGAPGERIGNSSSAGRVDLFYGSQFGFVLTRQSWIAGADGIPGTPDTFDSFGASLTFGDFNNDLFEDLAIGVPQDKVGTVERAGSVVVVYGAPRPNILRSELWSLDTNGVGGTSEPGDFFADSLAAGDLNRDGFADLAIGLPKRDVSGNSDAGAVVVLYGRPEHLATRPVTLAGRRVTLTIAVPAGIDGFNSQIWSQDSGSIKSVAEPTDQFGTSLSVGDFNGDGIGDLLIGVPFEGVESQQSAGSVNALHGSAQGVRSGGNEDWSQDS